MERRKCPKCGKNCFSSESESTWKCPHCNADVPGGQGLKLEDDERQSKEG